LACQKVCTTECPIPAAADIWAALPNAPEADANAGSSLSTVGVGRKGSTIAWVSIIPFPEAVTRRHILCLKTNSTNKNEEKRKYLLSVADNHLGISQTDANELTTNKKATENG